MLPVKILSIFLIVSIYIVAAANRLPDSDYESYLYFFNSGEALSGCYFEYGFCYFVSLANFLDFNAKVAYGSLYGSLLFLVTLKYSRNIKTPFDLFIGLVVMLLFLIFINDYYMAFHLYRQNFATLLFSILALIYPIAGFFIAGLFHSSIILLLPLYLLIRRIDFGKRIAGFSFVIACFSIYISSRNFGFLLEYLTVLKLDLIVVRAEIYNNYVSSGGVNSNPLLVYLFIVFFIARSRNNVLTPYGYVIFYAFVSAILLACFTSFNEMISYRFLVVAKGLSLPLLFLSLSYFVRSQLTRRIYFQERVGGGTQSLAPRSLSSDIHFEAVVR